MPILKNTIKRLFFGLEVAAPWPEKWPSGRHLDPHARHMTLVFLGEVDTSQVWQALEHFPKPSFKVAPVGFFDKSLYLPEVRPRVAAWHVQPLEKETALRQWQAQLETWLTETHLWKPEKERTWLPHVTLCRHPFNIREWEAIFQPLPMKIQNLHLYESVGNLCYEPLWSFPLCPPFEEKAHMADIAFTIYGETLQEIHLHAICALAFSFPPFLFPLSSASSVTSLDEIIIDLNQRITTIDSEQGCPFKAVSFHGELLEHCEGILKWEMIVDV